LNIREAYEESLRREGHERDAAQEEIVSRLEDLQQRLHAANLARHWLTRLFRRSASGRDAAIKGLYLWGGVGRGKTFLMDRFFETLAVDTKQRIHFHRMMRDVHARLGKLDAVEDPLDQVAADIAANTRVLCFDEFFVSDIGDAMLLGRLLDGLFRRGVTLIATSNNDGRARDKLQHFFDESASSQIAANEELEINSRRIRTRCCAKGIAWFEFTDICDGPRSQDDYIEIARWYPTVIVSAIPQLDHDLENQTRRFISLVDEFYDRRVKLIVSAATDVHSLYTGNRLAAEFERTISRLIEMQSTHYLAAPHLA
jgi:cell division protein ZapE